MEPGSRENQQASFNEKRNVFNKPLGTNGPPDSDKTQDIRMPYVGNGYVGR